MMHAVMAEPDDMEHEAYNTGNIDFGDEEDPSEEAADTKDDMEETTHNTETIDSQDDDPFQDVVAEEPDDIEDDSHSTVTVDLGTQDTNKDTTTAEPPKKTTGRVGEKDDKERERKFKNKTEERKAKIGQQKTSCGQMTKILRSTNTRKKHPNQISKKNIKYTGKQNDHTTTII